MRREEEVSVWNKERADKKRRSTMDENTQVMQMYTCIDKGKAEGVTIGSVWP